MTLAYFLKSECVTVNELKNNMQLRVIPVNVRIHMYAPKNMVLSPCQGGGGNYMYNTTKVRYQCVNCKGRRHEICLVKLKTFFSKQRLFSKNRDRGDGV